MTVVTRKITRRAIWMSILVIMASVATAAPQSSGAVEHPAEQLFLDLGKVGLSTTRVYHVRDAHIDRPGLHLTLEDGTIAFTEDILNRVTGALFQGEGEVLVLPPDRAERASLALFTGSAILEEKITFAYLRFNDATYRDLQPNLTPTNDATTFLSKRGAEASELASADALRLLMSFAPLLPTSTAAPATERRPDRLLHARLVGVRLGAFDLLYDSQSPEQVQVLQLAQNHGANYYDIWMSFSPKRRGEANPVADQADADSFIIPAYKIQARVTPPRLLEAEAVCELHVLEEGQRAFLFELSRYLKVTRVEADGHPLEFIHNPAVGGSQLARQGDDLVAVVFPRTLKAGERIQLKFIYGGEVLSEEANGLLSVGARGTWYPNRGLHMADFDLKFSYPPGWTLLATGKREAPSPGESAHEELQSHWVSSRPIPVAGFNLGRYVKATARSGNSVVEAYATQEMGLEVPKTTAASAPGKDLPASSMPVPAFRSPSSPAHNVQAVADRTAEAMTFFSQRFGEYPYGSLALTQAPGPASQGWPGLVFLSGYAFLSHEELASHNLRPSDAALARQTPVHETAHQWWGDLVMWNTYRDQWISEGLASYCALLELEARDPEAFHLVLDAYRQGLLQAKDNRHMWEAGPVTLGQRLNSSRLPGGYEVIAYGRGAWLFHMVREMLRDAAVTEHRTGEEPFVSILRQVQQKYAGRSITTQELLRAFAENWPRSLWFEGKPSLEWFWDGWIQGVSVPTIELRNVRLIRQKGEVWASGIIEQKDAPEDLVTPVPVYAEASGAAAVFIQRIFADGRETSFRVRVPAGARRLVLDPHDTLLRRHG